VSRACLFCGARPTTLEHVYPAWLRDALPSGGLFRTTDAVNQPMWEQTTFDVTTRVACGTCNNGWMSDLESAVKPLLTNAIVYGEAVSLSVADQRRIALWAIKTAFVLEAYRKGKTVDHVPEWHFRGMPRTRASTENADPPSGISVVIFGRQLEIAPEGIEHFTVSRSVGIARRDPPNDSVGYVATFAVGYVGFQIFGVDVQAGGLPNIWYGPWVTERTITLWPPLGHPVRWPPALVMSTADLLRLADLWSDSWPS
jgi:hypothetical protein